MEKNNQPGVGGRKFRLNLSSNKGVNLQILSDPVPYSREHKSKWKIVNWWRKWRGTYYEKGYKYTVKIVEPKPIGKPGKTKYTLTDNHPEKVTIQPPKVVGKIDLPETKKNNRRR